MKNNVVKKFVFPIAVTLYNIATLFWCYVLFKLIIFDIDSILGDMINVIIGSADTQASMLILEAIELFIYISFLFLFLANVALLTVAIFKKEIKRKFNILLLVFSVVIPVIFLLIPPQTFAVPLFMMFRFNQLTLSIDDLIFLKYPTAIYMIISAIIIILNILFLIRNTRKTKTLN